MAQNILPLTIKLIHSTTGNESFPSEGASSQLIISRFEDINFRNIINFICEKLQNNSITAFDYKDEDGDMITVRSDDEMVVMLSSYCYNTVRSDNLEPLCIHPKFKRFSTNKNKKKLKVDTTDAAVPQPVELEGSHKRSGNIESILAVGDISSSQVTLLSLLGFGNCGSVYKGKFKKTGEDIAVKVIALDVSRESQQQIISELDILHQCKSDVIISFIGAYFDDNKISICTEYMDGGSLDAYSCIPEPILGAVSVSVVQGLTYLWSRKILHRDVKPSNILINTLGRVKLCDFGISVQLIDSIAKTFIGTNAYMAPERIQGHDYSIHSEVWSLGVSLFELAAGHPPYEHNIGVWKSIVDEEPPRLSSENFSQEFVDFVSKCMQKVPEHRPKPENLIEHSFPQAYVRNDFQFVAAWVIQQQRNKNDNSNSNNSDNISNNSNINNKDVI